jgi:hypothetical protein
MVAAGRYPSAALTMPPDDWDDDWEPDADPDDPDPDEDFQEALTAAERNPSMCRR